MTTRDNAWSVSYGTPAPTPTLIELPAEFARPLGTRTILNPRRIDGITVTPATAKPGSIVRIHARGSEYSTATLDHDTAERVLGELLAAIRRG